MFQHLWKHFEQIEFSTFKRVFILNHLIVTIMQ